MSKSGRNLPYQEKTVSNSQIGFFNELILGHPLAVQYGGTGLDHPGSNGQVLTTGPDGNLEWTTPSPDTGTVTSVGLSGPSWMTITNSPITTSGVINIDAPATGTGLVVLQDSPTIHTPATTGIVNTGSAHFNIDGQAFEVADGTVGTINMTTASGDMTFATALGIIDFTIAEGAFTVNGGGGYVSFVLGAGSYSFTTVTGGFTATMLTSGAFNFSTPIGDFSVELLAGLISLVSTRCAILCETAISLAAPTVGIAAATTLTLSAPAITITAATSLTITAPTLTLSIEAFTINATNVTFNALDIITMTAPVIDINGATTGIETTELSLGGTTSITFTTPLFAAPGFELIPGAVNINPVGATATINLIATGANADINLDANGENADIVITGNGANSDIIMSTQGADGAISISAVGAAGAVVINSGGAGGAIELNTTGTAGNINLNVAAGTGNIELTAEGGESGILLNVAGGTGNIVLGAEGAASDILLNVTGATGNIELVASGGEGGILLTAEGAAGNIALNSAGAEGAIALNTSAAAGNITLTAEGAEGGIVLAATGAAANIELAASGGEGNINLNVASGTGNIELTAEGGEAGILLNVAGGTGNIALSNESATGTVTLTSLGGATGISLLAAGALTGIFINTVGAAAVTEISANGITGSILLQTLGASGEIDIYATGVSGVIKIIATGAGGQLLMGVNTGGGACRIYTSTGNTQLVSNSGAVQVSAPQGGFQVGRYGTYGGDDQVGHIGLHAHNNITGFATGDIEIGTHTQASFTGPGNITIDSTDAYTGNVIINAKGLFQLQQNGVLIGEAANWSFRTRSYSSIVNTITFIPVIPTTLSVSTFYGFNSLSAGSGLSNKLVLPDATTLNNSIKTSWYNGTAYPVTVVLNDGTTTLTTILSGGYLTATLINNGSSNGTWSVNTVGTVTSIGMTVPSWLSVSPSTITTSGTFAITGASTGTGTTTVLQGQPTLTSAVVTDTKSSFSDAPLVVNNTNTNPESCLITLAPNIATTNTMYSMLGQSVSNGNAMALGFKYVGSNNSANDIELGFAGGNAIMTLYNSNTTKFTSPTTTLYTTTIEGTSSTSEVNLLNLSAPNITGGYDMWMTMQKNTSVGNGAYFKFYYNGSGSTGNYLSMGVNGITDMMTLNYDGHIYLNAAAIATTVALSNTHTVTLDASAATSDYTFKYPATVGLSGQILSSTGAGTQWINPNAGTVTSVGATVPTQMTVTGTPITSSGTLVFGLNSPQGTGNFVLQNNPTLTSAIVSDSIASSFTTAPFKVVNTNVHPSTLSLQLAPNITSLDITTKTFGQDTSTGNAVSNYFKWVGNNNSANEYGWGFYGLANNIVITNAGVTTMNGTVNVSTFKINSTHSITLDASLSSADYTFKFPSGVGTSGQVLSTTGSGTQWINATGGSVTSVAMTVPSQLGLTGSPITTSGTLALSLNSPQGTGVIVLDTAPTLTGATVTQSSSSFTTGSLRVFNTNAHPATISLQMAPNITAGDATFTTFGQDTSTGNAVSNYFKWVGNNNSANEYGWGFYGAASNDIIVKKSGVMTLNPQLTRLVISDTISSFSNAPLIVQNTNVHPNSLSIMTTPNIATNDITVNTFGQDTSTGNAVSNFYKYAGNNNSGNQYGWGFYGGSGNDITVGNNNLITLGYNTSSVVQCVGGIGATNIISSTFAGQVYGWNGSVANPTGGPWNFTGNYSRNGNAVTIEFVVSGSWSSAAVNTVPYISGCPTFGLTIGAYGGVLDSYASNFSGGSGQGLPYIASIGTGGNSGHDLTFTASNNALLGFSIVGGVFTFGGVVVYYIH